MDERRECKIVNRRNLEIASLKELKKSMQQELEEDLKGSYQDDIEVRKVDNFDAASVSNATDTQIRRVVRLSGEQSDAGSYQQSFDTQSEIKRVEGSFASSGTQIIRDRGVSTVSHQSSSTHIVRLNEAEDN